jgi:hydroxymethylpyrimidine/phosphomethylpyrimidine kinase
MRAVLSIAGSDSIAGAGIQADLKTFAALGVYGTTAITAITSQNTSGIVDVFTTPPEVVRAQIKSVADDVALDAVKIGMLATAEVALAVAEAISEFPRIPVVIDPVMTAGGPSGRTLLSSQGVQLLKAHLLPLARVVTPNVWEAKVLSGIEVRTLSDARQAAERIFELGGGAVVVKGGHLEGPVAVDVLFDGNAITEFSLPRSAYQAVHGTGCTFASALAARLAFGDDLPEAVHHAKTYVAGLLNHFWIYTQHQGRTIV